MYEKAQTLSADVKLQPIIHLLNDRFEKGLAELSENIYTIENKLHEILNRRQPEVENSKSAPIPINDSMSRTRDLLDQLTNCNNRLFKVREHLSEII